MSNRLNLLIDAIDRVGIQNVSELTRLTGIPKETIRYVLKKRFGELGLSVALHVDHDRLGLERVFARIEFMPGVWSDAPLLLDKLAGLAFLTYHARELCERQYVTIFAIPTALRASVQSYLDELVNQGIIRRYELQPLTWTRHLALRSEYFDFRSQKWSVNWERVRLARETPPQPPLTVKPSTEPDIDKVDILLTKELQLESWRSIADISRKLGLNDRTGRWHYKNHVSSIINSYFVRWLPRKDNDLTRALGLIFEFAGLTDEETSTVRRIFNSFPFTWEESGGEDGYYQTVSMVPADLFVEASRFLTDNLNKHVSSWMTHTFDIANQKSYTIPYENFDEESGWFFDQKKALKLTVAPRPR